jgi:hypothetical protein
MSIGFDHIHGPGAFPELQHQELDQRLRGLAWPAAPPEVKQRCLQAVLQAANSGAGGGPPEPPPEPNASTNGRGRVERIERAQRYELTRWEPRLRAVGWTAPRRQPRFAAVL